jgi:hypothetical protein
MKSICSYCKKVLRDRPDDKISHGACDHCLEIELEKIRQMRAAQAA